VYLPFGIHGRNCTFSQNRLNEIELVVAMKELIGVIAGNEFGEVLNYSFIRCPLSQPPFTCRKQIQLL